MRLGSLVLAPLFFVAACAADTPTITTGDSSQAMTVPAGTTCSDLGFSQQFDIAPVAGGSYDVDGTNQIDLAMNGNYFDFTAAPFLISAVIVEGGPDSALVHGPWYPGLDHRANLFAPTDPSTGMPYPADKASFCFDYGVRANPGVDVWLDGHYDWNIEKSATTDNLTLSSGQIYTVGYSVTVTPSSLIGGTPYVSDGLYVTNTYPTPVTVTGITVDVDGTAGTITCPSSFPFTMAPGELVTCQWQATLPDTNDHTVTATTSIEGGPDYVYTHLLTFAYGHQGQTTDECVDVTDNRYGDLGSACASDGPKVFTYEMPVGPYEGCGQFSFDNTATYTTRDTGTTGSSTWVVDTTVPCDVGCSLTPGYWKTHSDYGPAPYDDTWALLADGPDTTFYLSDQTYYQVLWTSPRGSAYYVLAHAFIAAQLNGLNGADTSVITDELNAATSLFETYTPADLAKGHGPAYKALKAQFIDLATVLDNYNNGLIGPGHCDQ